MAGRDVPKRSHAKLADHDLDWLLELERRERQRLYRESEIWAVHRRRLLWICLGQGSACHLIDGRTGIKDFDLWTFFARRDDLPRRSVESAFRRGRQRDFGPSRFGVRTDAYFQNKFPAFLGRNVDIFGVAIPARPKQDPAAAVQAWLSRRAELPGGLAGQEGVRNAGAPPARDRLAGRGTGPATSRLRRLKLRAIDRVRLRARLAGQWALAMQHACGSYAQRR